MSYSEPEINGIERKYLPTVYGDFPYYDLSKKLDPQTLRDAKLWQIYSIVDQYGRLFNLREYYMCYHNEAISTFKFLFGPAPGPIITIQPADQEQYTNRLYDLFEDEVKNMNPRRVKSFSPAPYVIFENILSNEPVILNEAMANAFYNIVSQTPIFGVPSPFADALYHVYGLGFQDFELKNTCCNGQFLQYRLNLHNLNNYLNTQDEEVFPYRPFLEDLNYQRATYTQPLQQEEQN